MRWNHLTDRPSRPGGATERVSPVFLGVLAAAVTGAALAWTAPTPALARVGVLLLVVAGWVVSLCLHEFAHAYAAHRGGDTSIRHSGYLSLNPLRYAHPLLSIALPLVAIASGGIGLPGGAVQVHPHALRSPRWRALVSAAGPAVNVVLAVAALAVVSAATTGPAGLEVTGSSHGAFWSGAALFAFLQLTAALLNLLPVPGLDGWGILEPFMPAQTAAAAARLAPFTVMGLFVLLMTTPLGAVLAGVATFVAQLAGVPAGLWHEGYALLRFWT